MIYELLTREGELLVRGIEGSFFEKAGRIFYHLPEMAY